MNRSFIPRDLADYLEEAVEGQLWQCVLHGYIRVILHTRIVYDFPSAVIKNEGGKYAPLIPGTPTLGFEDENGLLQMVDNGLRPICVGKTINVFLAYLASYDPRFDFVFCAAHVEPFNSYSSVLTAACAAASLGCLPLTRRILDIALFANYGVERQTLVRSVLACSIDVKFLRKLRSYYYRRIPTETYWMGLLHKLMDRDDPEIFHEVLGHVGNYSEYFRAAANSPKIYAYLTRWGLAAQESSK